MPTDTATDIAARVRSGAASAADVLEASLARIAEVDPKLSAFQVVRTDAARAEANAIDTRTTDDRAALALAGVPFAIKDNIDVEGEATRNGSHASPSTPAREDHEIVKRLRAAGAVIIGKTRVPEFCSWAWTDSAWGVTRSPWDLNRTAGGSSGGSAAAVASGMVPLAHGSDGGGSIRIPAACCGLFGIKPGRGVVPTGRFSWYGLSEFGPLATTVDDAALALSVMSAQPALANPHPPTAPLRIALSLKPALRGPKVDDAYADAARGVADTLADLGHMVSEADPTYGAGMMASAAARAIAGIAEESDGFRLLEMEKRSRPQVRIGRLLRRLGLPRGPKPDGRWPAAVAEFFTRFDVLITPTLAALPIPADLWSEKGAIANFRVAGYTPFTTPWNVAGYPAAALPVAHPVGGFPLSVHIVASAGNEARVLSVARQLEAARPWTRHAPGL